MNILVRNPQDFFGPQLYSFSCFFWS